MSNALVTQLQQLRRHRLVPSLTSPTPPSSGLLFFQNFIYLFLERGERREKEKEKNIGLQTRPVPGPGTKPFALQDHTRPTEPRKSGPPFNLFQPRNQLGSHRGSQVREGK